MEPGFRSPLLEFFRRGEVARDIRLVAARGGFAPRAHDQLALLVLLVGDQDPEIASAAEATLGAIPPASLRSFLARSDVAADLREFFARRGIEPAETPAPDSSEPLVDTAPPPDAAGPAGGGDAAPEADALSTDAEGETGEKGSVTQKIASMTVAQRMSLAMKGSREERSILIRDPNRLVSAAVLSSPKLTESEIEAIAKMANVSEDTLRIIGHNRAWLKNYNVALALVRNPKAPVALSMNLLNRLNDRDLRQLSTNRNIPEVLRVTARKKVVIDK